MHSKGAPMEVSKQPLLDFIAQPRYRFTIPLFQRRYSWGIPMVRELWRDIHRAAQDNRTHFAGIILYESDGPLSYAIVDGQQRITTAMLLLSAFADYLAAHPSAENLPSPEQLEGMYRLRDGLPKLSVSPADAIAFSSAIQNTCSHMPHNDSEDLPRSLANKEFLSNLMEDPDFDPRLLWRGLQSLTVITALLEEDEDDQAIFESFNAKGVPLVTADLVRNYLLTAENPMRQRQLYEDYWEPMAGRFGDDPGSMRLNNAIRAWLAIRCRGNRAKSDAEVFQAFKAYCEDEYDGSLEELLAELLSFSAVWAENYRYHAVKKFRGFDWSSLGRKTLVSDRPKQECERGSYEYYTRHLGVDPRW